MYLALSSHLSFPVSTIPCPSDPLSPTFILVLQVALLTVATELLGMKKWARVLVYSET